MNQVQAIIIAPVLILFRFFRGEVQAKSGKKEQTQGHLRKKMLEMQRQIKKTSKDSMGYVDSSIY